MSIKIIETGTYTKETEYSEPSLDELYWYYRGTHAGFDPNNLYATKKTTIRRTKINLREEKQE